MLAARANGASRRITSRKETRGAYVRDSEEKQREKMSSSPEGRHLSRTNPGGKPPSVVVTDASPQTVAPSSQEVAGQQQQIQVDSADHVPAYSYQSK
ncbi:hypothetical protein GOODEAATRI_002349 [Goodea atripinnis]|uniref:Uncharacterized protein n=1 Tax=Goodea atripinnis TaxID=208336 RepID=A0ABV0NGV0_9TELE